uniref:Uncharacterized protein n=1 Tax=Tanacetum cinerariifolium TaxID=118510 RepID=A0A6L2MA11_TANCI|nr:hypothetical protein [Tanacetum cinerariifolium]
MLAGHNIRAIKDKVVPNNSHLKVKKTQVEEYPRIPSIANKMKSLTACNDSLNSRTSNVNAVCATWFPAQSIRSSNATALDLPYLLVLINEMYQSRQHDKSESDSYYLSDWVVNSYTGPKLISSCHKLDHLESCKSPTAKLFDVDSGRISIHHCEY